MSEQELVECPRCFDRSPGGYCLLCSPSATHLSLNPTGHVATLRRGTREIPAALAVEYELLGLQYHQPLKIAALRARHGLE